jgi:NitT/TauT family transport system substrate-binding protein
VSFFPVSLAEQMGEFAKENLSVQISILPVSESTVLLSQGRIDVATGMSVATYNAQAGGAKIKSFAPLNSWASNDLAGLYVRRQLADSNGHVDPCSLKGKTVSFGGSAGYGSAFTREMDAFLRRCTPAVSLKDLKLSTLGGGDLVAALQSGAVDAGVLYDPSWVDPASKGYAVLAVGNQKGGGGGAWMLGPSLMGKQQVGVAFVRAMLRTIRTYLQGDYTGQPQVMDAMVKFLGAPKEVILKAPPPIFDPNMRWDLSVYTSVQQTWISVGGLLTYDKPLTEDQVFDFSYLNGALAE